MTIENVEPEETPTRSLQDHLEAALDAASDETARFHIRHALQLYVEAEPDRGTDVDTPTATSDAGDSTAN